MVWHRRQPGALSSPKLRRLTAGVNTSRVSMGCVGHTSVHSDSGSCAWGSGVCARRVEQQQQAMPPSIAIATPVLGGPGTMRVVLNSSSSPSLSRRHTSARCVEQQQQRERASPSPYVEPAR